MFPTTKVALVTMCALVCLGASSKASATPFIVIDENYDNLALGQTLPGWIPIVPGFDATLPFVQQDSFNSAPFGAAVRNDAGVIRQFS